MIKYQEHISKIIENLYLGSFQSTQKCILNKYEINTVVSIGCYPYSKPQKGIEYFFVDLKDNPKSAPDLFENIIPNILPIIYSKIKEGNNCLIHCSAGKSRSATVVAAYLINYKNMASKEAVDYIKDRRSCVYPNYGFIDGLQKFERNVL